LMVTAVPHWKQFPRGAGQSPEWSARPHREVEKAVRARGATYFDSLAPLAAAVSASDQPRYYYRDDMHFNPRGNALWAQVHIDVLRRLLVDEYDRP
jgi:hypothetical protein